MTDQDENRPLSRREIRLREMAAAGGSDAAAEPVPAATEAPAPVESEAAPAFEVEISPFDEDGRQRSRREMRELREQAIAAMQAEAGAQPAAEAEVSAAVEAEAAGEPFSFDALLQEAAADEAATESADGEPDVDEPASVNSFFAAAVPAEEPSVVSVSEDNEAVEPALAFEAAAAVEPEAVVKAEPATPVVDTATPEQSESEDAASVPSFFDLVAPASAAVEVEAAPEVAFQASPVVEEEPAAEAFEDTSAPSAFDMPVSATTAPVSQGYSFPDIAPLDEGQSVFDDPSVQVLGGQGQGTDTGANRGFDDLISRAVAQESATTSTNTSALILPNMPDSDGLAGPLGETGELFITGSYDLPKSLGETGGHTSLHDAGDVEALDELGFVEATPTGMMAPVSASRAVSARATQGPVVAEATKDKSKLPVVLIATGGVLVLGAVGLIIWAAASGLFG